MLPGRTALCMLSLSILIVGMAGAAQSPPVENWSRTFAGPYPEDNESKGHSLLHTPDDGYIIVGEMGRNRGLSDIWLMKLDPSGTVLWERTFGSTATHDRGSDVAQAADGGYVLCGSTRNPNTPYEDAIVIRTDERGAERWERTYRRGKLNNLSSIEATADGGSVFTGSADGQAWIMKIDGSGVILWERVDDSSVRASDAVQTGDGGYLAVLIRKDRFYLVQKLDGSGNVKWETRLNQKQLSAPYVDATLLSAGENGCLVSLHAAIDSRLYPYLVRLDEKGGIVWERQAGIGPIHNRVTGLLPTEDGGYALLCNTLCKTDERGDTLWVFNRSSGVPNAVQQTGDGGFMLTGYRTRKGATDLWVSRLSWKGTVTPQATPGQGVTAGPPAIPPPEPSAPVTETPLTVVPVPPRNASPPRALPATPRESPPPGSPVSAFTMILAFSLCIAIKRMKFP